MRGFFSRGDKFQPIPTDDDRPEQQIPGGLWVKCSKCSELIYTKELEHNDRVCPKCGYHFRLRARERISALADPFSFHEWDSTLQPEDPLHFNDGSGPYDRKLKATQKKT